MVTTASDVACLSLLPGLGSVPVETGRQNGRGWGHRADEVGLHYLLSTTKSNLHALLKSAG